jgi:HrpA-like RNA helicase
VEIMHHRTARLKQLKSTYVQNTVDTALHVHKTEPKGHMLLFLTGKHEVEQACRELRASSNEIQKSQQTNDRGERLMTMEVYPLYSTMEPHEQASVFDEPPPGVRKVIVATNIAQASLSSKL